MDPLYSALKFVHVMSFVFMSVPLFNLIVVNERAALGTSFDLSADGYMENVIRHGATRCFVFQATAFVSGVLLLVAGPLGIGALWTNWVLLAKAVLLVTLTAVLSYAHLSLQPRIDALVAAVPPSGPVPQDLGPRLRPLRVRRKRLATFCLFLVITTIVLGLQVNARFGVPLTAVLIALAAVFAWRVNRTLVRFGWV